MSENVGGVDLFGSGGHLWIWDAPAVSQKVLEAVGTYGAARMTLGGSPRICTIAGDAGGPALLKASAASKALADAALSALELAITDLQLLGTAAGWEDDAGHTGSDIVVDQYIPAGPRRYSTGSDGTVYVWQPYRCRLIELSGRWSE